MNGSISNEEVYLTTQIFFSIMFVLLYRILGIYVVYVEKESYISITFSRYLFPLVSRRWRRRLLALSQNIVLFHILSVQATMSIWWEHRHCFSLQLGLHIHFRFGRSSKPRIPGCCILRAAVEDGSDRFLYDVTTARFILILIIKIPEFKLSTLRSKRFRTSDVYSVSNGHFKLCKN